MEGETGRKGKIAARRPDVSSERPSLRSVYFRLLIHDCMGEGLGVGTGRASWVREVGRDLFSFFYVFFSSDLSHVLHQVI